METDVLHRELDVLLADCEQREPFPPVSDKWAYECYDKHFPEIKRFLVDYATLLLTAKEVVAIDESHEIQRWIEELTIAGECYEDTLRYTCFYLIEFLLKPCIDGNSTQTYAELADSIAHELSQYEYRPTDLFLDEYDGNYTEYYERKRMEMAEWQEN